MKIKSLSYMCLMAGTCLVALQFAAGQELQVNSSTTPEEMVEILIGSGVEYDNVAFTGADISRGSFSGGPGNIGIENGIILTSGSVEMVPGPYTGAASYNNNVAGDPDLEALTGGAASFDACVLEFDFVPYFNYVYFQFVFGSEEYPEYVGTGFNDVFGFFISGPGITGPYSDNSRNIALLPGTETPVSIENVNHLNNSQYYVENTENFIQYDGFTTVLVAESEVTAMETYHIKLAVGDIMDYIFDSGVLLQASSFCSSPVSILEPHGKPDQKMNVCVFPNPADDLVNVFSVEGKSFTVKLTGQDGRVFYSETGSDHYAIDIRTMSPGVYFIQSTTEGTTTCRKFCKR